MSFLSRVATILACSAVAPFVARADEPAGCDQYQVEILDSNGVTRARILSHSSNRSSFDTSIRVLSDILDAIDLVPAPTHFRRLRLSEPSCALPSDCGKDARIFKCNGNPMCPSSEGRYPLGGISYVRRYREFEEVMRSVERFDDGLSPAVRRAFPDLLHAFNMFVLKNVKLYGPETSFYDSQSDLFYCNQLHDAQADLIQRDSWGRLLVHSLDALRGDRYEGIEVEKTSNMRLWIRRQAGLHVRLGELASTNLDHGTCKVVATNGELGITTACSQPPCDGVVCDTPNGPAARCRC